MRIYDFVRQQTHPMFVPKGPLISIFAQFCHSAGLMFWSRLSEFSKGSQGLFSLAGLLICHVWGCLLDRVMVLTEPLVSVLVFHDV